MFSIRAQNPQPQTSYHNKRQTFRNQIRRQKLHEYKNKIRHKLIFDNEVDANVLKNISLTEVLLVIMKYQFPQDHSREQVLIDDCNAIYDIQKPQNAAIYKAIEGFFLHITASRNSHVINMLEEKHIFTLAQILQRKTIQMKPLFKEKSYVEGKTANDLRLPPIYQRIVVILAQCAFGEALFFEESIRYVVHVINQLLLIFPRHTRIVQACVHMVGVSLHNKTLVDHLLFLLSDQESKKCLLTRILDVTIALFQLFSYQVKHFDPKSQHSSRTLMAFLFFYEQVFVELIMNDLYPNMRQLIFKRLRQLSENQLNDKLTIALAKTLLQLYNQNFGNVSQIVLETAGIFDWVATVLHQTIIILKEKKFKENIGEKMNLCKVCFAILGTVFETPDPEDQYFISLTEFLAQQYDQKLDLMLQDALKIPETPIIHQTLELIKTICNWGDFVEKVYDNKNIIIKLFYFCRNQSFAIKKQAIFCLCNIIEGYFDGKAYHDHELCDMYDQLIEKFDFLEIMVENLDNYTDVTLNVEILRIAKILCYFWQSDPELGKYNRFWAKFAQNGGQIKLNIIMTEERNKQMKELASDILDNFVVTEEYQYQI